MAEVVVSRRWSLRGLYVALAFLLIFARLLPIDTTPGGMPGPDLIVCLTLAWVLRRPEAVPILLIAATVLLTDFLFMRPLGLWTIAVVLGAEYLRSREVLWRDLAFPVEWLMVAMVVLLMTVGNAMALAVFAVDQPPFGQTLLQMLITILAYPLVVAFSALIVGLRKVAPGAVDELGRKV